MYGPAKNTINGISAAREARRNVAAAILRFSEVVGIGSAKEKALNMVLYD